MGKSVELRPKRRGDVSLDELITHLHELRSKYGNMILGEECWTRVWCDFNLDLVVPTLDKDKVAAIKALQSLIVLVLALVLVLVLIHYTLKKIGYRNGGKRNG